MDRLLLSIVLLVGNASIAVSQGSIRGKATDQETGEPLIGATVLIQQNGQVASTDLDGNFVLDRVPVGVYDVECSYVGHGTQRVVGARVEDDRVKLLYFQLQAGNAHDLGLNITVTAEAAQHLEAALLTRRRKASFVSEVLSSEEIFQLGDKQVAQATRRLTGVTIEDDRFIYVRGLGGRYVNVLLNGAVIAQSDLHYSAMDLTLLPSTLLDHLTIYKSYAAELPGSFAGGALNIQTRSIPEQFTQELEIGLGVNTQTSFRSSFMSYDVKNVGDWLGVVAAHRALPESAVNNQIPKIPVRPSSFSEVNLLNSYTNEFNNDYSMQSMAPPTDLHFAWSIANQNSVGKGKKAQIGYGASLLYNNTFSGYTNGISARYGSAFDTLLYLDDHKSTQTVQWGAMANLAAKWQGRHRLNALFLFNQSSDKTARIQDGIGSGYGAGMRYHTRLWWYELARHNTAQLSGKHLLDKSDRHQLAWTSSLTQSVGNQPDLRTFSYAYQGNSPAEMRYYIADSIGQLPAHYFRQAQEINLAHTLHFTSNSQWGKIKTEWKYGLDQSFRRRQFDERRFFYGSFSSYFNGNIEDYTSIGNFLHWHENTETASDTGVFIYDGHLFTNNYKGFEHVWSAFVSAQIDWSERWQTAFGLRYEYTYGKVSNERMIDSLQVLNRYGTPIPSVSLHYRPNETMVVRLAYAHTLARPTFREQTPFVSFDYIGDYWLVGNPKLKQTYLHGVDLRWEWFPGIREVVAVGGFFKHLTNPIERRQMGDAQSDYIFFSNAPQAWLAGAEVEIRKNLGFLHSRLRDFSVTVNAAYIYSQILRTGEQAAPLFGQAPYIVNAGLHYRNETIGTQLHLAFNISGKRLIYNMIEMSDIYELPRTQLDFQWTQTVGKHFRLRLSAQNLLNAPVRQGQQDADGNWHLYRRYTQGLRFFLGLAYFVK